MITSIIAFDTAAEQALYAIRNPDLVRIFLWFTELASVSFVLGFAAAVIIFLIYRKRWQSALGLAISVLGSGLAVLVLKELVARPRPETAAYVEFMSAFPSSHAVLVIAFYGFLLWMVWKDIPPALQKLSAAAFTVFALLIGFSRLYLGVHYPSDVLAGYLLGGLFVLIGIKVVKFLEQKTTSFPG